jgi:hypothetical protein
MTFLHMKKSPFTSRVKKFGKLVLHDADIAEQFVEKKALPTIEKANKITDTALKVAIPISAFVAPEATPFLIGAEVGTHQLGKVLKKTHKAIEIKNKTIKGINHLHKGEYGKGTLSLIESHKAVKHLVKNPLTK